MTDRAMKTAFLRIETEDVGMTQAVQISIGDTPIVRFLPGTRHAQQALQIGEELLMHALRPLLLTLLASERMREVASDYVVNDEEALTSLDGHAPRAHIPGE